MVRDVCWKKKLSFFGVAIMYVGTIMGAGFASGREIWQFFGVFGERAYIGIALIAILFVIFGLMTAYIARKLNTNDMGRIIGKQGVIAKSIRNSIKCCKICCSLMDKSFV